MPSVERLAAYVKGTGGRSPPASKSAASQNLGKWLIDLTVPKPASRGIAARLLLRYLKQTHHQLLPTVARIGHHTGVQRASKGF